MGKRIIFAVVAVFVLWSVLDFVIHGVILGSTYQETAGLWRPMAEMKTALMRLVVLISAIIFVYIYAKFFASRGVGTAIAYGLLFGLGAGIGMGYGTYSVMPIPVKLANVWFLGSLVEYTLGGLLTGIIVGK